MADRYISFSQASGFIAAEDTTAHPNEMKFRGVLVKLDIPSDRPPNGAEGHRIMLPKDVAQKKLGTLIGMGLNYDPDLDAHAPRRKVGVVQKAYIKGNDLWVEGVIWKHDFPEAQKDLKRSGLGMSMEVNQVAIKDASQKVWEIEDLCFLGGTILRKDAAAYHDTRAIAAARADVMRGEEMSTATKKTTKTPGSNGKPQSGNGGSTTGVIDVAKIARVAAKEVAASAGAKTDEVLSVLNAQTPILAGMAASLEKLALNIPGVTASKSVEAEVADDEMESTGVKAAKKKAAADDDDGDDDDDDDDDEDMDASDDANNGDLDDLDEDKDNDAGRPGHVNDDIDEDKGDKTTVDDKIGKTVNKSVSSAREDVLRKQVSKLTRDLAASNDKIKVLEKKIKGMGKQVSAASNETTRRSHTLPAEIASLLSKANVDGRELMASGSRLSVDQADGVIAAFEASTGVKLDATKRIQIKNQMQESGLLDDGRVNRGYAN